MASPLDISEQEIRERSAGLLSAAIDEAARLSHNYIGTEHLYNALTKIEGGITQRLLMATGLDPRLVRNEIRREAGQGEDEPEDAPPFTPRAYRVLAMAVFHADDYGSDIVTEPHLLLALLQEGEGVAVRKLMSLGMDATLWVEGIFEELKRGESEHPQLPDGDENHEKAEPDRATRPPTPLLDKYGRDLTELARRGKIGEAIGREREIRAVARTLTRSKKNNPLLIGDAGVGKTAVIEGLAYNIVKGTAPSSLLDRRIVQIEIGTLVAGTSLRGQFEERLVGIVDEARNVSGIILFIDEIHTIVGAGDTIDSNLDAANILKPALSRGEIVCIGATTHEEYHNAIAQDAALERRFRTITIEEPSAEDTLTILTQVQGHYSDHHKVQINTDALQAAVTLSAKYMIDRRQPDKALDLLDEACARVVIHGSADGESSRVVTGESVAEVLAEWTGIPLAEISEDERRKYQRMEADLKSRVIGQDHAIASVADAIKTNRAGLADPCRPVGVFLFLGPSGVGKTELAKSLAEFLFGNEDALIRLDMSEFHDEHTVARLIGSPPGYKDSQRGGQLTEALRRKPYSVVLLDEVEKAAPEVFDLFLQVFDDGRLTDSRGVTIDARHAVWIMTSNIGTSEVGKQLGLRTEGIRTPNYNAVLKRFFRPEFLNRLDEVIIFNALSEKVLVDVLDLHLQELRERLAKQHLTLQLDENARALILGQGYDPANGARPLRRTIERLVTRPLSQAILDNLYPAGSTVLTSASEGRLSFATQQLTAASEA